MKQDNMPTVARFWNNIAEEFDAIYTGNGKNSIARWMDRVFRADIYGRFDWVMRKAGDLERKTVCDVGCGSGRFVAEFARRGARHVTGLDIAPNMIKLAAELTAKDGVAARCDFVVSDILNWKTSETYDLTVAIGFWDYIMEPPERLRRIRAITKPGGMFLSAWPRLWTWRMPVRKVRLEYLSGCPVYFYRKPHVIGMLEAAGFEPVSSETVGKLHCIEARAV